MESEPPKELIGFLARYPEPVVEIYLALRDNVFQAVPEATEIITNASYSVACGYTFTHSIKQAFAYIGAYSKHVNLGFVNGSGLVDPESRLQGDGKSMRHLSLHRLEDIEDPYPMLLFRQAVEAAALPKEPLPPKTVITVMKKAAQAG